MPGFKISAYSTTDTTVAVVIGSAAVRFTDGHDDTIVFTSDKTRNVVAIPVPADAEAFARTFESSRYRAVDSKPASHPISKKKRFSLATLFTAEGLLDDQDGDRIPERMDTTIVLGPDVHSVEVIDLGLRLADIEGLEREPAAATKTNVSILRRQLAENGASAAEINILLTERVELNALTSDALVAMIERKLATGTVTDDPATTLPCTNRDA
jgi:hypothetical protein